MKSGENKWKKIEARTLKLSLRTRKFDSCFINCRGLSKYEFTVRVASCLLAPLESCNFLCIFSSRLELFGACVWGEKVKKKRGAMMGIRWWCLIHVSWKNDHTQTKLKNKNTKSFSISQQFWFAKSSSFCYFFLRGMMHRAIINHNFSFPVWQTSHVLIASKFRWWIRRPTKPKHYIFNFDTAKFKPG